MSVRLQLLPGADDFATDHIRIGDDDETRELQFPWMRPPVPPTSRIPQPPTGMSRFYVLLTVAAIAALILTILVLTRGQMVTFGGLETIPTDVTR